MATPHDVVRVKSTFARAKEEHKEYGHDVWATLARTEDGRSETFIYNVCTDVRCLSREEFAHTS